MDWQNYLLQLLKNILKRSAWSWRRWSSSYGNFGFYGFFNWSGFVFNFSCSNLLNWFYRTGDLRLWCFCDLFFLHRYFLNYFLFVLLSLNFFFCFYYFLIWNWGVLSLHSRYFDFRFFNHWIEKFIDYIFNLTVTFSSWWCSWCIWNITV